MLNRKFHLIQGKWYSFSIFFDTIMYNIKSDMDSELINNLTNLLGDRISFSESVRNNHSKGSDSRHQYQC